MKPLRTWIIVADGARARFLALTGLKSGVSVLPDKVFEHHAEHSRNIADDKPGRSFDSMGHNRHAIQPRVDAHDEEEKQFLENVIGRLNRDLDADAFDNCIVVAPPRAMGVLRHLVSPRLKKHVLLEIDKDMTKHADKDVAEAVTKALGGRSLRA